MAVSVGPHSSDRPQLYMQQIASMWAEIAGDDIENPSTSHSGTEQWSIGDVFDDGVLEELEPAEEVETIEQPVFGLRALDQIYGALETTLADNKKIEGLRAVKIPWDKPKDGRTWDLWLESYDEAGLIEETEDQQGNAEYEVTPEGEIFLNTDPRGYEFDDIGVENIGEVYHELTTQGYGDTEEFNGRKIEALFMYSAGLGHQHISKSTGAPESTVRTMANNLQDLGVLTDDYMLTAEGLELCNMMIDQLDQLEEATVDRVEENYSSWRDLDPEEFEGNSFAVQSLNPKYA